MASIGPAEVTVLRTLDVPALPTETPTAIARANAVHKRVAIRNIGPTVLLVATTAEVLTTQAPSDVVTIPLGVEQIIPISPTQILYLGSVAAGGRASITVSPAIPLAEWERS
jgi:hypothetical protein